jgi:hypothetical protein
MCNKNRVKKTKAKSGKRVSRRSSKSTAYIRMFYIVLILFGILVLAGIALFLRIETPGVWMFLLGIGNWLVLANFARNLR